MIAAAFVETRLWTPPPSSEGLLVVAQTRPLLAVVGGRLWETDRGGARKGRAVIRGGWEGIVVITSSAARHKEPTRIIGHPDLASGASVQRGEALYVSVAEAIYRESQGDEVEVHLIPTPEDAEALADLRVRARHRWENDRLPDGWTRPLPPPTPKDGPIAGRGGNEAMSDEMRSLAERLRAKNAAAG